MRYLSLLILIIAGLAVSACSGSSLTADAAPHGSSLTPPAAVAPAGGYIVVFKPGTTAAVVSNLTAGLANKPAFVYNAALSGFAGALSPAEAARLTADPRVSFVEPDRAVYTCELPDEQVAGSLPVKTASFAQQLPWGVDRIDADLNSNEGTGVGVAVIDTGIDLSHPDLLHAVAGANFVRQGQAPIDDNGHGTHVSGIIAAADNSFGYIGVADDATVIAVKVLNRQGSGTMSQVIAGVNWVAANKTAFNISVANMSLGAAGYSSALYTAIQGATNAGVTFVVAAGNNSANAANYSPAGFDNVICVSALNSDNTFAYYSNWGSVVDLIAPGTNVPSLWKSGGYKTISGTSMASPHVAGAAALYVRNHPGAGFSEVRSALIAAGESGTWSGDPDGISEMLVDAQYL